ncbi:MAG: prevent-host-death protein [Coriobacteriia bacterium]|nr:prevent-host-death protein [Coriobacteriia bacterium]
MTVGELKRDFSSVLDRVQKGETVQVLYGRAKKPVAQITPIVESLPAKRPIGLYEGKMKVTFSDNFKFKSTEEFLGQE